MKKKFYGKQILSLLLVCFMVLGQPELASAASTAMMESVQTQTKQEVKTQSEDQDSLPTEIKEGETYTLTKDITLGEGQQIEEIAGTLDGNGHVITLSGKALAKKVSGTIQNLGVAGSVAYNDDYKGTIAENLTGTIKNSYSTADVESSWNTVGGLVGTISGGKVRNCYFAGSLEMMNGGIAAYSNSSSSEVSNCYYLKSMYVETIAMQSGGSAKVSNCASKTADELKSEATVALLNTAMEDTGFVFEASKDGGYPVLTQGKAQISWAALEEALADAKKYEKSEYTEESYQALEDAVAKGEALQKQENVTQEEITNAASAIKTAIQNLKRQPILKPVALPKDTSQLIEISSQADFSKMENSKGKYFVLTKDVTINDKYTDESFYMNFSTFAGTFDGQGHTITFDHAGALFDHLSGGAVIQNVSVKGTLDGTQGTVIGPFGKSAYGAFILNCRSDISGEYAAGLIGKTGYDTNTETAGSIANCIAIGDTKKGALCNATSSNFGEGVIANSYWLESLGSGEGAKTEKEMKSLDFVKLLNDQKGENGISWGQGKDGYPYFGENQDYNEGVYEWPETGENKYQPAFTSYEEGAQKVLLAKNNARLEVFTNDTNANKVAGKFSLEDYNIPEGSHVVWNFSSMKPSNAFGREEDTGVFYVYNSGDAILTATQVNSDGSSEILATIAIHASSQKMEDVKLYIGDKEVTDGTYTVEGSSYEQITVKAKYEGSDKYQTTYSGFTYTADEEGSQYLNNRTNTSSGFSFKQPGTATITVASKNQPEIKKTVTITSKYVPVESVKPAISGTYKIHSRNANSDGQESDGRVAFNPILGSAVVTPSNASNAAQVTITSDDADNKVAYYTNGEKAYIPKQAGTITFTATIKDTDPSTGKTNTVSGDSKVTFEYQNNVTSVSLDEKDQNVTIKAGETSKAFTPNVTGALDDQGYGVTESALNWTYSKPGIAKITKKASGYWKKNGTYSTDDPDYGDYLIDNSYEVVGLSEGTVVATGTPIDTKNNVKPVTITITVTKNDSAVTPDMKQKASDGAKQAAAYIKEKHSNGYVYGNEWIIYTLLENDKNAFSDTELDAYYDSVKETVKTWSASQKPTDIERVTLALAKMGKDVTNVGGVDLASMIYNSNKLTDGSNELIYALMALDAADVAVPAGAKWTRQSMITELLKFQNQDGGFSLTGNGGSGTDVTAMALQALANYKDRKEVKASIEKAVEYLKGQMQDDFGYGTSETTAQVLLALTCLGIDPTSSEVGFGTANFNMITNLMQYQKEDGGFAHLANLNKSNEMATVQTMEALDAYAGTKKEYWNPYGLKQTVMVTVLGDKKHNSDEDENVHVWSKNNLTTWAENAEYRVKDSTAMEAIDQALLANGMKCKKTYGDTYIASVTNKSGLTLAEKDNGKNSGWLYSVNGTSPNVAASDYDLEDGDAVVLHYTDNYLKEGDKPSSHEHKWSSWKTTSVATVFSPKIQTRTCSVCKEKQTRKVGKKLTPTIKVNASSIVLQVKQSTTKVKVTGLAKGDSIKSWKSSNTKIVKVDKKGKITAQSKTGKASITVTLASGKKATIKVNVQKGKVHTKSISGLPSKITLKVKGKKTLKPVLTPMTSRESITYASSDKKIATVSKSGVITAKKAGKVKITVRSGAKKKVITVTVKKK